MICRTVLEWGKLPYGPEPENPATIPADAADRLAAVAKASPLSGQGDGVLEHGRHALRARGVVGVLAVEGCSLEILPKIDVAAAGGIEAQNAAIRRRLVHMLAVALDMKIDVGVITDLDWQRDTLLEILIRIFSEKLADAVRQGMPRRYVGQEDDLRALRGSLDVTRQFTRHAGHAVNPSRLACRFDVLSEDIAINRIMKAAVSRLSRLSQIMDNQRRLREIAFVYSEIADVPISALRWDEVIIDRWRDLLGLARLLLNDRTQTTTRGASSGFALLFEMSMLFEEYVGRLIERAVAGTEFRISRQGGRLYCLTEEETERRLFQTKPDILMRHGGEVIHVIDTKWKRISSRMDDAKRGVSQGDLYQMMAYGQLYRSPRLTLLYPHHGGLGSTEGIQARHRVTGHDMHLETASFDVADGKDVVRRLRRLLFPPG
jgi:5-methylcytosine-specific restriction enzyme subunit McrC